MKESQNLQQTTDSEEVEENSSNSLSNTYIQNNLHFVQNIDINALNELSKSDSKLASRAMALYENQFEHAKNMDEKIVNLEEQEQNDRRRDRPWQRFFVFLSIFSSVGISVYSLMKAYVFYLNGASDTIVGLCISIPIGIVAVNLLGIKNKGQK